MGIYSIDPKLCLYTWLLGRAQFKPWVVTVLETTTTKDKPTAIQMHQMQAQYQQLFQDQIPLFVSYHVVIPYTHGLVESFKNTCGEYGIQTYFKGNTTIKQVLLKPKEQDPKDKKCGAIYSFQCNHIACDEEYIGETARTLGERCKEHLKQPSHIHAHIQQTGHNTTDTSFSIIGREDQGLARTIKESVYIKVNNPTLNQNIGKYNLSHI